MNKKCCNYTVFCDSNGQSVLSRMTLENGILQIKNWNLDGSVNNQPLVFDDCPIIPVTNLIDIGLRMNSLSCINGQLSTTFSLEVQNNLSGIVDGSIIQFEVDFSNQNYYGYEIELYDDNYTLINQNTIKIINASLFSGFINNIKIKFIPYTCNPVTITMNPTGIFNLAPTYGIGTLSGDSKIKS